MHKVFVFLTAVSLLSGLCGLEVLAGDQKSFRDARVPRTISIGSDNMGGQSSLAPVPDRSPPSAPAKSKPSSSRIRLKISHDDLIFKQAWGQVLNY